MTYISRLDLMFPIIPVLGVAVTVPLIFPSSDEKRNFYLFISRQMLRLASMLV